MRSDTLRRVQWQLPPARPRPNEPRQFLRPERVWHGPSSLGLSVPQFLLKSFSIWKRTDFWWGSNSGEGLDMEDGLRVALFGVGHEQQRMIT